MMIATRLCLPVGDVWRPPQRGNRRVVLDDAVRGRHTGPLFIVRAVEPAEYCAWVEANTGEALSARDVARELYGHRFYEISVD